MENDFTDKCTKNRLYKGCTENKAAVSFSTEMNLKLYTRQVS